MQGDLVGLVAVVLLFGGGTLFLLSISPIGKALAAKILGRTTAPLGDEASEELEELRHEGEQVVELGERVDFLERLLAQQREAQRLPPAR